MGSFLGSTYRFSLTIAQFAEIAGALDGFFIRVTYAVIIVLIAQL